MEYKNDVSPSQDDYDDSKLNTKGSYFYYDKTKNYFPTVHYSDSHVPIGNAKPYCMHINWSKVQDKYVTDKYHNVTGLPTCSESSNI